MKKIKIRLCVSSSCLTWVYEEPDTTICCPNCGVVGAKIKKATLKLHLGK